MAVSFTALNRKHGNGSFEVFTNSLKYKNENIVNVAMEFKIYWNIKVKCNSLVPSDILCCIYWYNTIRVKKDAPNVWDHTNGNNATITNFVALWKPQLPDTKSSDIKTICISQISSLQRKCANKIT